MRWVLDTNILIAALLWQGAPRSLLRQGFAAGVQFHTSPELLAELHATLHYPKLQVIQRERNLDPSALFDAIRIILHSVTSPPLTMPVSRDPDDDAVLACALASQADLIVSGDLLVLECFRHIPIITAVQALDWLQNQQNLRPVIQNLRTPYHLRTGL